MTSGRNDVVKVQLRVFKSFDCFPGSAIDYFVAVVGPGIQLGNYDPRIAPRCDPIGLNFWTKDLWLPKDSFVHYKFLVIRSCTGKVIDIESIIPHTIFIGQCPIMVEHNYNKVAFAGKEVQQQSNYHQTSDVGRKEIFHVQSLNFPPAHKVGFVVPKIKDPPKYVPPRNIGMIHCKSMVPSTVRTNDENKTEADDKAAESDIIPLAIQNSNKKSHSRDINNCRGTTENKNYVQCVREKKGNFQRLTEDEKSENNNTAKCAIVKDNNLQHTTESNINVQRKAEDEKNNVLPVLMVRNIPHGAEKTKKASPVPENNKSTTVIKENLNAKSITESNNTTRATQNKNISCEIEYSNNTDGGKTATGDNADESDIIPLAIPNSDNTSHTKEINICQGTTENNINATCAIEENINLQGTTENNINAQRKMEDKNNNVLPALNKNSFPPGTKNTNNALRVPENNNTTSGIKENNIEGGTTPVPENNKSTTVIKENLNAKSITESNNTTRATQNKNIIPRALETNNSITGKDETHEKNFTEKAEEGTTKQTSYHTGQKIFRKKCLALAVAGVSLISAIGYFAFL